MKKINCEYSSYKNDSNVTFRNENQEEKKEDNEEHVEGRLINYLEVYQKRKDQRRKKEMKNYFHPDIKKDPKLGNFDNVKSKFREVKQYPDGLVEQTRPEIWILKQKQLLEAKIEKKEEEQENGEIKPIDISDLKKHVKRTSKLKGKS